MSEPEVEVLTPSVKVRVLVQIGDNEESVLGDGEVYVKTDQDIKDALADFMVYIGGEIRKPEES